MSARDELIEQLRPWVGGAMAVSLVDRFAHELAQTIRHDSMDRRSYRQIYRLPISDHYEMGQLRGAFLIDPYEVKQ